MNSIFQACSVAILSRAGNCLARSSLIAFSFPSWKTSFGHVGLRAINLDFLSTTFRVQSYSSRRSGSKSPSQKTVPKPAMEEEKDAFFVVRKGDVIGVYKSFSDCQAQVGSSICDPPVSVFKAYSMPKDAEEYLLSCGLRNAFYSIKAADLKDDLFGPLLPCTILEPCQAKVKALNKDMSTDKMLEVLASGATVTSCILHFDGASKGNPGKAGAGAVLRNSDGSLICRVGEGLGRATCNAAEYRAIILGMTCALKKGFTDIRVIGDSKLVCMQMQERWRVKNENLSILYKQAKKLKDMFLSFEISHVLRSKNKEADAEANLAVQLADGEIQEEIG